MVGQQNIGKWVPQRTGKPIIILLLLPFINGLTVLTAVYSSTSAGQSITITAPGWGTWLFRGPLIMILVRLVMAGFIWQCGLGQRRERQLEAQVPEKTVKLRERVKELGCLYSIIGLAGQPDLFLQEVLKGMAALLPASLLVHICKRRRRVCISRNRQTKFNPP